MDIFSFDINMEEYEEIDYYLRPSRKNRRVLGICFAVISTLSIILAITEYRAVTDGYVYFNFNIVIPSTIKILYFPLQWVLSFVLINKMQMQHGQLLYYE